MVVFIIVVVVILPYVEYYLFLLQLKAVFLNLVYFADEHFQANRLLIKYW